LNDHLGEQNRKLAGPRKRFWERFLERIFFVAALASVLIVVLIFVFLFSNGLQAFRDIDVVSFLTGTIWQPVSEQPKYGLVPMLTGSLLVTGLSILFSVPISILCATYLSQVASPTLREIVKPIIEMLAAIPSVVYGFVALIIIADAIQGILHNPIRLNALNASIVLSLMVAPTIISISEDAISSVPHEYKEAALALGASKWEMISKVVLPSSLSGIFVAVMLGVGRAIGETMAVLMAAGNAAVVSLNPLDSVETMTAVIAIEMGEVTFNSTHFYALFAVGGVLFLFTLVINLVAQVIVRRYKELGR
jgi:phosphate transport system permease protein